MWNSIVTVPDHGLFIYLVSSNGSFFAIIVDDLSQLCLDNMKLMAYL